MSIIKLCVDEGAKDRLDAYIARELSDLSRTYIQKLIKDERVEVNGLVKKARYSVKEGDNITINLPAPKPLEIIPENIPINIVYEDQDIVIVNKDIDMVVHPAPGNFSGTLVNGLLYHVDNLSQINGVIRPGIVHRLDKDTTGLLVVAKNDFAHRSLSEQLKNRSVLRVYVALVHGIIKEDSGLINQPIGRDPRNRKKMAVVNTNSKEAITSFHVIKRYSRYTLVKAQLETGRTHQIRVHFSYLNHPLVGDPLYSNIKNEFNLNTQLLHAKEIAFIHPRTNERVRFVCELPDMFNEIIEILDNRKWLFTYYYPLTHKQRKTKTWSIIES